ncbi:hypothetical protein [Vibrio parahaemolyticus]|uniref:hypothetical protein n=1 Tax=Vibrio parahaemolyticus TaxID=670 RepID=UPI0011104EFF|nr:hypothetical protein [Vibrio parahaemolyticus]
MKLKKEVFIMFRFLTGFVSQTYSFLTSKIAFVVLATSTILATSGDYSGYYFMLFFASFYGFFTANKA